MFAIAGLKGLGQTAVYTIARFIITPMIMPSSAVINISIPFLSEAWRVNDKGKIIDIYKKSALVLVLYGGFLFYLIWSSINDILHLLPNSFYGSNEIFKDAKYVILFLGVSRLCDFATSVNAHIMQNSKKYYWIDLYSNICLILIMVPLNYFLIKKYGILGAGYASFIVFFTVNVFKALFLYIKENMHPFSKNWWLLIEVFVFASLISYFLNYIFQHYLFDQIIDNNVTRIVRIILRSSILSLIIIPIIYSLKISEDINYVILLVVKRSLRIFGKK